MRRTLVDEIAERGRRERDRGGPPDGFPGLPPVPVGRYTDPDFATLEQREVFGRSWLFVAHADELPLPGDFVLLRQLLDPVMLIRGQDGLVRAFYNTCQHRGGPLVSDAAGNCGRRLVCGYHSWT